MDAILLHGMGRTPLAMSILAARLRAAGIHPHLFGYSVTFERWEGCVRRLERFITRHVKDREYIMIGHSLGTVLTRAALPHLTHKPAACFLLTPPTQACKAARYFAPKRWVKLLGGEMAQLLADQGFMESIPVPSVPTKIYAGTAGPRGHRSPFGDEPNDSVLMVKEMMLPGVPLQTVPVLHTFIMNSKVVTQDIVKITRSTIHKQTSTTAIV
jgi:pimeloyl-ACP methyl ester carboxylesterase